MLKYKFEEDKIKANIFVLVVVSIILFTALIAVVAYSLTHFNG